MSEAATVAADNAGQEQAQAVAPKQKAKAKAADGSNLIADVAVEIENMTKAKALNLAEQLAKSNDENNFRLGGVLDLIMRNSWFDGYPTFGQFVFDKFGMKERKAFYLMGIYNELVKKQIPWEKVSGVGWTKLKELARYGVLTADNVDEWVAKATTLSYAELMNVLEAPAEGGGSENVKTSSDLVRMTFKLKADQAASVSQAVVKAKAELGTEFDNAALEAVCLNYLGSEAPVVDVPGVLKAVGIDAAIEAFNAAFPEVKLGLEAPDEPTEVAETADVV